MQQNTVTCPYCGQIIQVDNTEDKDTKELRLLAIKHCKCPQARDAWLFYSMRETKINNANTALTGLFFEDSGNPIEPEGQEVAIAILREAIAPVVDGYLHSVAISIPGGVKASISRGAKDAIRVERSDITKQKQEV